MKRYKSIFPFALKDDAVGWNDDLVGWNDDVVGWNDDLERMTW